jgi:hypothetical protein
MHAHPQNQAPALPPLPRSIRTPPAPPRPPQGTHVVQSPTLEGYLLGRTFAAPDVNAAAEFNVGWGVEAPFTLPRSIKFAYPEATAAASDVDTADPLQFWRVGGWLGRGLTREGPVCTVCA